ncbi:MAG: biopolymer transporter ExbD [Nitrospirae bacterium]|nr:biopolymer transporter ExbD [Nitrospirota bacterium]
MLRRPSLRKHRIHGENELQLTALVDIMVTLISFMLVTAVFVKMSSIDLSLPEETKSPVKSTKTENSVPSPPGFRLIVSVSVDQIDIFNDKTSLGTFKKDEKGSYDFTGIANVLKELKKEYPEEKSATILSNPSIHYNILVSTIDAVREGFPDISLEEL